GGSRGPRIRRDRRCRRASRRAVRRDPRGRGRAGRRAAGRRLDLGRRGRGGPDRTRRRGGSRAGRLGPARDHGAPRRGGARSARARRAPPLARGFSFRMTVIAASTAAMLTRWVGLVLRFRKLVIVVSLLLAALAAHYASGRLGINTDTANMISAELPWRQ